MTYAISDCIFSAFQDIAHDFVVMPFLEPSRFIRDGRQSFCRMRSRLRQQDFAGIRVTTNSAFSRCYFYPVLRLGLRGIVLKVISVGVVAGMVKLASDLTRNDEFPLLQLFPFVHYLDESGDVALGLLVYPSRSGPWSRRPWEDANNNAQDGPKRSCECKCPLMLNAGTFLCKSRQTMNT